MTNTHNTSIRVMAVLFLLALVCGLAPPGAAQEAFPGDLNHDGLINILDVQASINMALGDATPSPEADVDEDGDVYVTDIQVITNTALGVSGLLQPVVGTLDIAATTGRDAPYRVVAVSEDGRIVHGQVHPESGQFRLMLPVRTAWSFALVATPDTAPTTVATLRFALRDGASTLLPLLRLSRGVPVDLGRIHPQFLAEPTADMRLLLGEITRPLDEQDADASGVADVLEALIFPLPSEPEAFGFVGMSPLASEIDADFEALVIAKLQDCLNDGLAPLLQNPNLTGVEAEPFPRFLDPLILCLYEAVETELNALVDDANVDYYAPYFAHYRDYLGDLLEARLPTWLLAQDDPELIDANLNGVPDYIEGNLCLGDTALPGIPMNLDRCGIDANGDGIPDFAEDHDGDQRPNYFDPDARTPDDLDADGVPNHLDVDDDNDGVPDYADAAPADPTQH